MEDAAETNSVFEDLVDVQNSVVRLLRSTICHVIYMQYHLRHPPPLFNQSNPIQSKNPDPTFTKITHRKALCHSLSLDLTLCLVQLLLFNFVPPSLFLAVCMRNSGFLDFGLEVLKNCFFFYLKRDEGRRV